MSGAIGAEGDLSQDAEARLTVVGALRLVRFLPVLEVSGLPVLDEVRAIAMSRGRDPFADVDRDAATIRRFGDVGDDIPQDIDAPEYLQLHACDVALAVAGTDWAGENRRLFIEVETSVSGVCVTTSFIGLRATLCRCFGA